MVTPIHEDYFKEDKKKAECQMNRPDHSSTVSEHPTEDGVEPKEETHNSEAESGGLMRPG